VTILDPAAHALARESSGVNGATLEHVARPRTDSLLLSLMVRGVPVPKGSTRSFVIRGRAVTTNANAKTRPWEQSIAFEARHAIAPREPSPEPVRVWLVFHMPRPKGHWNAKGTRLVKSAPAHPAKKPDLDKLVRCVLDALTHVVWVDDAQVVAVEAEKRFGGSPGVEIVVRRADAAEGDST